VCVCLCRSVKDVTVLNGMRQRYASQGYPEFFTQTSKTIMLFQVRVREREGGGGVVGGTEGGAERR
jgi:hypothetical protein